MAKDVKKTVQVDSDTYAGLQRLAAVEMVSIEEYLRKHVRNLVPHVQPQRGGRVKKPTLRAIGVETGVWQQGDMKVFQLEMDGLVEALAPHFAGVSEEMADEEAQELLADVRRRGLKVRGVQTEPEVKKPSSNDEPATRGYVRALVYAEADKLRAEIAALREDVTTKTRELDRKVSLLAGKVGPSDLPPEPASPAPQQTHTGVEEYVLGRFPRLRGHTHRLGREDDEVLANELRYSRSSIKSARKSLGIPELTRPRASKEIRP